MIISHKYKFIFIAVPKSASQYIRQIFRPYLGSKDQEICALFERKRSDQYPELNGVGHISAERIKKAVGDDIWNSYYKFAFIRDPLERIISIYSFRRKKYIKSLEEKGNIEVINKIYDEKPFTRMFYEGHIQKFFRKEQSHWIFDENDNLMIDFVGSMNTLHSDLNSIFKKVGLPEYNEKDKINKTKIIKNYTTYYNKSLISLLNNNFKRDLNNLKSYNFYTENTLKYIQTNPTYFEHKKHLLYGTDYIPVLSPKNIALFQVELNNVKEQSQYIKNQNRKHNELTNSLNTVCFCMNNSSSNTIIDEIISKNTLYEKGIHLVNQMLKPLIPFNYKILTLKYIELNNKFKFSYLFRRKWNYKEYHYTLIIPLNNIEVKRNNRRLLKDEDNNRYPIQLRKGNLFFVNSITKVFFEYPNNTKLLLIRLLHDK